MFARQLADVITGTWDLSHMSHSQKVEFLIGLTETWDALMHTGWAEHTNDWDWAFTIESTERRTGQLMNPVLELKNHRLEMVTYAQLSFQDGHDFIQFLEVSDESDHLFTIDNLTKIHVEEA